MVDLWRDFWLRETGTGQEVVQLHDRYMMMMMRNFILLFWSLFIKSVYNVAATRIRSFLLNRDNNWTVECRHVKFCLDTGMNISDHVLRNTVLKATNMTGAEVRVHISRIQCSEIFFLPFYLAQQPPPHWARVSLFTRFLYHTHNDAPQSVGLLWTSDQPDTETSTWQHTKHSQQRNIHAPGGIRTHSLSRRAAADPRLRPRGHWDRQWDY